MLKSLQMKRKRVIIIVVILITGVLGTFLLYRNKQITQSYSSDTKKRNAIALYPSPIPTGAGNRNNPTTWSRYIFNHEFSIAYPPFWQVVLDQDGNGVTFMTAGFHQDDDFSMPYGNSNEVVYTIFGQNDTSDFKLQDGNQFPSDTTSETMVVTHLQHLQIAGFPAVEFDFYPTDNTNFFRTRISIHKKNKIYKFSGVYAQDAGKQLFEEMIRSLQFI